MSKSKKLLTIALILIALLVFYYSDAYDYIQLERKGSYQYVIEGYKEEIYERILLVKKFKGESEVNKLLFAILDNKNRDIWSKHLAISYVGINNMKEFLPSLKLIQKDFETISDLPKNAYVRELLDNTIKWLSKL